jgi:hypothetical protein
MKQMNPKERWLIPWIETITVRPGTYLGTEAVDALDCYIEGYAAGRAAAGFPRFGEGEETLLDEFTLWLKEKVGRADSNLWRSACIQILDPSEHNARTFCARWKEFLAMKGISVPAEEVAQFAERWMHQ